MGLFGLEIKMIIECFLIGGKWDDLNMALKIWIHRSIDFFERCLAILLLIKSWPGDFFECNLLIVVNISDGVIGLAGSEIGSGAYRNELTEFTWSMFGMMVGCRIKVSDSWFPKRFAFVDIWCR